MSNTASDWISIITGAMRPAMTVSTRTDAKARTAPPVPRKSSGRVRSAT
jgi:hypothetical protein